MNKREAWIFTFFLCTSAASALESSRTRKQYRSDYEYNTETDAFYKLNLNLEDYNEAMEICKNEGADLMVPLTNGDMVKLQEMLKKYPYYVYLVWIAHQESPKDAKASKEEYVTEDPFAHIELPTIKIRDAIKINGDIIPTIEKRKLPFICKVEADDAPFNAECGVYGKDYQYVATVRSCYKISQALMTWDQANVECQREGSHLVVLNSKTEQEAVWNLLKTMPDDPTRMDYSAGFKAQRTFFMEARVFRTIFDETLEEAGYSEWAVGEPSNYADSEYCGSIYKVEGKLSDFDCFYNHAYICEKEIHLLPSFRNVQI